MQYVEFVGRVQNKARLASSGEAVRTIHATLNVLGQRLSGGEVEDLADQLPREIGSYLREADSSESFELQEFFERVADLEGIDLPVSTHHARGVISVVEDAVTAGEMRDVRQQLPDDWDVLFESGSEGEMNLTR